MTARPDRIAVDVINCARCQGKHDAIEFIRRARPLEIDGRLFPWWAACPTTGEVINLRTVQTEVASS